MGKVLFDKIMLRNTPLRNRLWRSATWLGLADCKGLVTDDIISTYRLLAEGGVGLIITGLTSIAQDDATIGGECKFYDDSFVDSHRRLTDTVHRHGCPILLQTAMVDGPVDTLSTGQVESIVESFGLAARRAERAGYDGVQIHAAHFFYLSKFISPLFNHRTDRFAGAAILPAILSAMRAQTHNDFIVTIKMNSSDEYPGGLTTKDFIDACRGLEGIDAIEVSANVTSRQGIRAGQNEGSFLTAAAQLAETVRVPVSLVGGLRSIGFINQVFDTTKIAFASLSRPLVCEPDLPNRWLQGHTTPSHCVSCNSCYRTPGHQCIFNLKKYNL